MPFQHILTTILAVTIFLLTSAAQAKQPNVLLICADDHAAYVTGAYGNRQVRTPNLDRLAAEGMRFDRAYCNSPVCTASRQSFLTGRYPRTIGVTLLRTALPESETTLAEMLKLAGYETAAIGKMHFNSNLKHGFDLQVDHRHHREHLKLHGRQPLPEGVAVLPQWKPFRDPARIWLNGFHRPFGAMDTDMAGTYFAKRSADYIKSRGEKPFFLIASFYEPHSPFRFPVEYADRYDPSQFEPPRVGPEDDDQIPAIFRELTEKDKQGIAASYYTSVEFMDKNVGVVLDALQSSGKADETLVIYIGDHGYFLGQHGRIEKHSSYEEAIRSPLLVRYPGRVPPRSSTAALVEFIDIAPTILELCGLKIPQPVQGKSLKSVLEQRTDSHRKFVVVEYAQNDEAMIRDQRWKLVFQRGKRRREDGYATETPLTGNRLKLYDVINDPAEMTNLIDRPQHTQIIERLRDQLIDHLRNTSRTPELIPHSDDPLVILDHCVQPRDVTPDAAALKKK